MLSGKHKKRDAPERFERKIFTVKKLYANLVVCGGHLRFDNDIQAWICGTHELGEHMLYEYGNSGIDRFLVTFKFFCHYLCWVASTKM